MTRLMVLFIPHLPSAATPPPKRHTAELGYIALPRRADPLSNFTEGLHTPAGLNLTASGHLTYEPTSENAYLLGT
jgi:hypothetical protein